MAQGLGSPIAAVIFERYGSWIPLFETIIAMGIITGPLALFVLKGLRRRFLATAVCHQ
jgi:MFS transporter, OFA family, oxalate/formate antiporter